MQVWLTVAKPVLCVLNGLCSIKDWKYKFSHITFQHLTYAISSYAGQKTFLLKTSRERKVRIGGETFKMTVAFKNLKPESCLPSCLNALSKSDHLFMFGANSSLRVRRSRWTWFFHTHPVDADEQPDFLKNILLM